MIKFTTWMQTTDYFGPRRIAACKRLLLVWKCLVLAYAWSIGMGSTVHAQATHDSEGRMCYQFVQGQKFGYRLEIEFTTFGNENKISGFLNFRVDDTNVTTNLSGERLHAEPQHSEEGTGTAFAISADGLVLTCAHCVPNRATIEINLDGNKYPAKVVCRDNSLDVAVLKVELPTEKKLVPLKLAKGQTLELAQDVRAIGFPLSDLLGESVKISRGAIAGFIKSEEQDCLQIDIGVNHGNSGGPLIDDRGAVVGLVNAKISGFDISQVGIAVPVKSICKFLEKKQIPFEESQESKILSGPELARRVTPSVFLLNFTTQPSQVSVLDNYRIHAKGMLQQSGVAERTIMVENDIILGTDGTIIDSDGTQSSVMLGMLGRVCTFPFAMLPEVWEDEIETSDLQVFQIPKQIDKDERELYETLVVRTNKVTCVEKSGDVMKLSSRTQMATIGGEKLFEIGADLKGTLTFDGRRKRLVSREMEGIVTVNEKNEVPVKLSVYEVRLGANPNLNEKTISNEQPLNRRKDDGNRLELLLLGVSDSPEKESQAKLKPEVRQKLQLTDDTLREFLDSELDSLRDGEISNYLQQIINSGSAVSDSERISSRLTEILESGRASQHFLAFDALLILDPEAATSYAIEGYQRANVFSRRRWIIRLGKTGHPDAADVLCDALVSPPSRASAQAALTELGTAGENAVLNLMRRHSEKKVLCDSCLDVLALIGTAESIPVIARLVDDPDFESRNHAKNCIDSIQSRMESSTQPVD